MSKSSNYQDIREHIKSKRSSLDEQFRKTAAQQLAKQFITTSQYKNAQRFAAYIAVNGECDPKPLVDHALKTGKSVFLPVITENRTLKFAAYTQDTPLQTNRFGIPEPATDPQTWFTANQLDLICVPLVAFDSCCNRLGMGGGFYDRTLPQPEERKKNIWYIGIAYELQKTEKLLAQPWDIPMDYIVTEKQIYSRSRN